MALSPPRPDVSSRAAFLVMIGWYLAIVVAFGLFLGTLSGSVPAGCGEVCDSERSRMLLFGLYVALPAMFLALLVSLVTLAVLVPVRGIARRPWWAPSARCYRWPRAASSPPACDSAPSRSRT